MELQRLESIMDMLERHLGASSEIVLHDYNREYENTVVAIRNGHITGRKIGDGGGNLGLEADRGELVQGNRYNYINHTRDNRVLRSSATYLKDSSGKVVGALCVHTDITQTVRLEHFLREYNNYPDRTDEKKAVATDVRQLLEHFLIEGQRMINRPPQNMDRNDRLTFLKYLDDNGVFLITRSSERVCEFLGISRYTLYSCLDMARRGESETTALAEQNEEA